MRIKISADSTCDLSPQLIADNQISIVPLYIVRGEESLRDGVTITPDDVYAWTEKTKRPCSTAAVNVEDYAECFRNTCRTPMLLSILPSAANVLLLSKRRNGRTILQERLCRR